jgi:hypothetical protein
MGAVSIRNITYLCVHTAEQGADGMIELRWL